MNSVEFQALKAKADNYDKLLEFAKQLMADIRYAHDGSISTYYIRRWPEVQKEFQQKGFGG